MTAATSYGQAVRIHSEARKTPRKTSGAVMTATHAKKPIFSRIAAALLIVAASWVGWSTIMTAEQAQSSTGPVEVVNYTVRPGDTLWSYANRVTPQGGNVAQTVQELKQLNNLDSASLTPGQSLLVPVQ